MSDEAPVPPVYDHVVERLAQRLADGDENAHMPEYRKRAAKLLAEVQKPTPVPLAEQIDAVQHVMLMADRSPSYDAKHEHHKEALRSVLTTLQQHERALAVVEAARNLIDRVGTWTPEEDLAAALTALDDAASAAATPAGKGERG